MASVKSAISTVSRTASDRSFWTACRTPLTAPMIALAAREPRVNWPARLPIARDSAEVCGAVPPAAAPAPWTFWLH